MSDPMQFFNIAVPLLISIVSAVVSYLALRAQRRKDDAAAKRDEATGEDTLSEAALRIVASERTQREMLERRVDVLWLRVQDLQAQVVRLENIKDILIGIIMRLTEQIIAAGLVPVAELPEELRPGPKVKLGGNVTPTLGPGDAPKS